MDVKRKHPLAECESCPLAKEKMAPTCGDPNSKVAFVSRSPGKYDIATGVPFSNPHGSKAVLEYRIARKDIITTNVVLCRTDDPSPAAIKSCKPRLEDEIKNCSLVIAAGTEATIALTRYRAVFTARPFVHNRTSSGGTPQRVIVTNNPAIVVRDSDKYPDMVDDFKRAFDPIPPPVFPSVEIINDVDRARVALERWTENLPVLLASDLEWQQDDTPTCAGFSARGEKAVVFGLGAISDRRVWDLIRRIYERTETSFIWHNGKSDTKVLVKAGVDARVDEDTYLMSVALDERPGYHSLEYLMSTQFGWPDYEPKSVKHFKTTGEFLGKTDAEKRMSERELYKYNGWDTAGTFQLYNVLEPKLDSDRGGSVRPVYKRLLHAGERFRIVELNGFPFDSETALNINEREAIPRMLELSEREREITKHPLLNPNSSQQLKAIIYDEWGLKHSLRDAGPKKLSTSTGKEVREIIERGEFISNLENRTQLMEWAATHRAYKKIQDIRSRYIEGLVRRAQRDGKIYGHFNVGGGTVSGRASSNDPNLQNIIREGYENIPGMRTMFLPSPGNVIISADFSQAELRTCAKLSGDDALLGIYRDSTRSLHKERAAKFYGPGYTKEEYVKSKNINFGVTYGQGADAFAQMYHMDKDEAQEYINDWWGQFSQLKAWTLETAQRARKDGYVISPFGHKRRFHLITDENLGDVERESVSFLPQNIAAWLTICALCDLVDNGIRIVATVHDSIVADIPISQTDEVAGMMREVMIAQASKQLGWDDIPFEVDVSIGPNWGDLHDWVMSDERIAA
jgi:uracil-DNA glycosylase family 4